jgi:hypothetical protein
MMCVGIGKPENLSGTPVVLPGFENFSFHQLQSLLEAQYRSEF